MNHSTSSARHHVVLAALALILGVCTFTGCGKRPGMAYVEIENDQGGFAGRPEPIAIDPRVEVVKNEFQRRYDTDGSSIRQRIVIRGPVMIVPAPTSRTTPPESGNTTQPDGR